MELTSFKQEKAIQALQGSVTLPYTKIKRILLKRGTASWLRLASAFPYGRLTAKRFEKLQPKCLLMQAHKETTLLTVLG